MIDLDFKGIGKKAPGTKKNNRLAAALSVTKIADENDTLANETTRLEETVVEARMTRRSSTRLSQAGIAESQTEAVEEPVKKTTTSKILVTKKASKVVKQRSKSADSNEASEKEEEAQVSSKKTRSSVRGKKRSIIEDAEVESDSDKSDEGDVSRSSRCQTRRSKSRCRFSCCFG